MRVAAAILVSSLNRCNRLREQQVLAVFACRVQNTLHNGVRRIFFHVWMYFYVRLCFWLMGWCIKQRTAGCRGSDTYPVALYCYVRGETFPGMRCLEFWVKAFCQNSEKAHSESQERINDNTDYHYFYIGYNCRLKVGSGFRSEVKLLPRTCQSVTGSIFIVSVF